MKYLILGVLPFMFVEIATFSSKDDKIYEYEDVNYRMFGGSLARLGGFPYMVGILDRTNQQFCGGSIIATDFVLTAAHCEQRAQGKGSVVAGITDLCTNLYNGLPSQQLIKINKWNVHESYRAIEKDGQLSVDNDIALLQLEKPFQFNQYVSPVKLASQRIHADHKQSVTFVGWGRTISDGKVRARELSGAVEKSTGKVIHPCDLRFGKLRTMSDTQCKKYSVFQGTHTTMCVGTHPNGDNTGSCKCDSGGPLVIDNELHCIASLGNADCSPLAVTPSVCTRVYEYRSWIKKIQFRF